MQKFSNVIIPAFRDCFPYLDRYVTQVLLIQIQYFKYLAIGGGEIFQCVKYLSCNREHLSSDLQHAHGITFCLSTGEVETGQTTLGTRLAKLMRTLCCLMGNAACCISPINPPFITCKMRIHFVAGRW